MIIWTQRHQVRAPVWSRGALYSRARASAEDKSEVKHHRRRCWGSPCPAVSCCVCAPSASHVRARSHSKRTMRLFTVSTLLLFFFSSGEDTLRVILQGLKGDTENFKPNLVHVLFFGSVLGERERSSSGEGGEVLRTAWSDLIRSSGVFV